MFFGFPTRFEINQFVQSVKEARSLKFRIQEEDLSMEQKQRNICAFVFDIYPKNRFSQNTAQIPGQVFHNTLLLFTNLRNLQRSNSCDIFLNFACDVDE